MSVNCVSLASLRSVFWAVVLLGVLSVVSVSAQAQMIDTQALLDRLDRLERDIRTLNQQLARSGGAASAPTTALDPTLGQTPTLYSDPSAGGVSRIVTRLDAMEQEMRNATGLAESLSHNIDQTNSRLDKLMLDLDYRLNRLEGNPTSSPSLNPSSTGLLNTLPSATAPSSPLAVTDMGAMPPVGSTTDSDVPTQGAPQGTMSKDGIYQPSTAEQGSFGTANKSDLDRVASQVVDPNASPATLEQVVTPTAEASETVPATAVQEPVPAPTPAPTPVVQSVLPEGSIQDQYKFALNLTRQSRYLDAEIAFKAFIAAHGTDALVGNAHYWLGETFYVRKNFMESAQSFFAAYQNFPKGVKAPDALLKLGMSMANLDKPAEACATFGKLRNEFGNALKNNIERALARETARLKCTP